MKRHIVLTLGSLALVAFFSTGCWDDGITAYKITGGGKILDDCNNVTVAFTAQPTDECDGIAKGQLQLVDHNRGIIFHGVVNNTDGVGQKKEWVKVERFHYEQICTDYIVYGGCNGRISYPNCPGFEAIDHFELTVSIVEGCEDPVVCVKVWDSKHGKCSEEWSGVLELGNLTIHDKGELDGEF